MNKHILFAGLFFILTAFFSSCAAENANDHYLPPELIVPLSASVDTAVITRGPVAELNNFSGITRVTSAALHFGAATGHFGELLVHVGDHVTESQLLARLDITQIERDIATREEHIIMMELQHYIDILILSYELASAREDLQRNRIKLNIEIARERHELALSHAQFFLDELYARMEAMELRAPFDGVITFFVDCEPGQWVNPFSPVIFMAQEQAAQEVFVEYIGRSLHNTHRAIRAYAVIEGREYTLVYNPLTKAQERSYTALGLRLPVRFTIVGDDMPPLGAYVAIYVYTQWVDDVLRIPVNALLRDPVHGFYTYRVTDGTFELVPLEIGVRTATFATIISGLEEGEIVLVRP